MPENKHRINLQSQVNTAGEFEILAITAGIGNTWEFTDEVLKESLPLWEGTECFIDHAWFNRSVRDLAGVCHSPKWNEESKGIQLNLKPIGPSKLLLQELGQQILTDTTPPPDVGFSADILFTSNGNNVSRIIKVHSVDLVFDPAREGVS